ncbi:PEP-CTERM sorting domain-containing protein [Haloferula sp.]|uniref:PEP-CTERM sorting domain-containing protein n=1 Tax=Haloferula sp. TaxID=2497595 RepID=UPI003C71B571
MNTSFLSSTRALPLIFSLPLCGIANAAWTTNFESVTPGVGGSAAGVWREVTNPLTGAGSDTAFAVNLTTNGEVKAVDGSSLTSRIDESFPWRDLNAGEILDYEGSSIGPLPFAVPLPFEAGVNGDFINIQTEAGGATVITFTFGATIKDPMLSFTDIEVNSTLTFSNAFSIVSSTPNLSATGLVIGNNGFGATPPFNDEAAGSLQFTGNFTELEFTVNNSSSTMEDRTGYVVTTAFAPVPEPTPLALIGLGCLAFLRRQRW